MSNKNYHFWRERYYKLMENHTRAMMRIKKLEKENATLERELKEERGEL